MFRSRILAITLPCLAIFGESTWAQVPRDIATQRVVHDCFGSDPKDHRTCYITQSCGIDSSGKAICLSTESSPSTSENSTAPNRAKAPHSPAGKHNPPPPHQTSPNSNDYSTDAVIAVGTGFALLALFGLVIFGRKRRLQTDTRRKQGQSVSHYHLRQVWPLPNGLGDLLKRFDKVDAAKPVAWKSALADVTGQLEALEVVVTRQRRTLGKGATGAAPPSPMPRASGPARAPSPRTRPPRGIPPRIRARRSGGPHAPSPAPRAGAGPARRPWPCRGARRRAAA